MSKFKMRLRGGPIPFDKEMKTNDPRFAKGGDRSIGLLDVWDRVLGRPNSKKNVVDNSKDYWKEAKVENEGPRKTKTLSHRSFEDAVGPARLNLSWMIGSEDINDDLIRFLPILRDKARSLELTSDYVRRFLGLAESNVVGADGFRLQVKARKPDGSIDKLDTALVEKLWNEYSKAKNVSVTGRSSLRVIENMIVRGVLRDGEVFIRKIIRKRDRRYPMKLQFIPPEWIDESLNREESATSNEIVMGIERDEFGKALAYYMLDEYNPTGGSQARTRIPASEMLHIFIPSQENQIRGYSALVSSIFSLKMLDGIKEASVTNFRVSASKMGFFTRTAEGVQYIGDGTDSGGNTLTNVSPGQFETLPVGTDFKPFEPDFPAEQYDAFMKSVVRSISSGWGISYNGLANDYSEVNYSSARIAALEERELWKKIQREVSDQFLDPLYESWLDLSIMTQTLPVPDSKFDKFNEKKFIGRTWTWVDPANEVTANVTAIENGLTSRTRVCAGQGLDFDEIVEELAHEEELAKENNVTFGKPSSPSSFGQPQVEVPDEDESQTEETETE